MIGTVYLVYYSTLGNFIFYSLLHLTHVITGKISYECDLLDWQDKNIPEIPIRHKKSFSRYFLSRNDAMYE